MAEKCDICGNELNKREMEIYNELGDECAPCYCDSAERIYGLEQEISRLKLNAEKELTKDDYYEIEKILDMYAGRITESIRQTCNTGINLSAIESKDGKFKESLINDIIKDMENARKKIKKIRDKLEKMRKENGKRN